ncbi:ABC transporter ATP-binding protein [Acidiferrimicrobium sp. IK]|uniref:ABC transporter ATP-binding protein n=1 Tax=Acidiferrimicrobium sp. IK TaxID=2871700 RepID=UPI0021CB8F46|nr:ABC transporter ATP-binding protein [Acidiferrimicrobium sp. IK]MCU4186891.1 ABC transporter ATP-binding protein [Acidiferrimicrobium sp. IK]
MSDPRFSTLRFEGVTRRFGGQTALADLDLSIHAGEFIALLGASGCGKSTALNCLAGLLPLSGGSIWLDERRIDGLPPERRDIGMVFQNYALFPHMSVRRNVGFGLQMRKVPKKEAAHRVDEAIRLVQLEEHVAKFPAQLSGGQQQRVAIARAIVIRPPVVVMDEPLSNLDAKLRLEMRMEIRRLHQALGLTTVYVTHDQEEALSLADRLVVLRDGRVQQVGTPEDVYCQPANRYVAGFMGYRNLIELPVSRRDGERVTVGGGSIQLEGTARDDLPSGRAVAAIRPEDLVVSETGENRFDVVVEVVEYHGREQSVQGRLPSGEPVYFRTEARLAPGDRAPLAVAAGRVLIYPADGAGALAEAAA